MYESVVVIIKGKKYILTYNVDEMSPEDLAELVDLNEDIDVWSEQLCVDYDSQISEYEEIIID